MFFRINPIWWPALLLGSPLLAPGLFAKNKRFTANRIKAEKQNQRRFKQAQQLDLPALANLQLTVLVE